MKKKPRVLVVDDEESIRFSFHCFLTEAGFDVDVVSGVEDAKYVIAEQEFDVAVIDKTFPGGQNGMDLISYINRVQPFCRPIIVSGYPLEMSGEDNAANPFAFLYKPVSQEELCMAVEKAMAEGVKNH